MVGLLGSGPLSSSFQFPVFIPLAVNPTKDGRGTREEGERSEQGRGGNGCTDDEDAGKRAP